MPDSISREEYLRTLYRPDLDWLDGELGERHLGDLEHSMEMGKLMFALSLREKDLDARVLPSLRLQVSASRYRVTDLCLVPKSAPNEPIPSTPPLLCVEVLSPGDRATYLQELIDDLLAMSAEAVWVLDPRRRKAWVVDGGGQKAVSVLRVPGTAVTLALEELFKDLEKVQGRPGLISARES